MTIDHFLPIYANKHFEFRFYHVGLMCIKRTLEPRYGRAGLYLSLNQINPT